MAKKRDKDVERGEEKRGGGGKRRVGNKMSSHRKGALTATGGVISTKSSYSFSILGSLRVSYFAFNNSSYTLVS